ncbi:MAG: alpha-glucan family phosphorylase [Moraxellaceae bacterium]|nr:alpha-glucan family phosphorylase [Moraxellaceae bacterium]
MVNASVLHVEVNPELPATLGRLRELAGNLWYSWDRPTRSLFSRLHPALWNAVGHSPRAMLKRVDESRLTAAAEDSMYLNSLYRVLSAYDLYHQDERRHGAASQLGSEDVIAYFCAEFGFHASLPIYSGGLGILAGDHCKAASDANLPFVAIGLLYRQGYFSQQLDKDGIQHANYNNSDFEDLPVDPVLDATGAPLVVSILIADRPVRVKIWLARAGRIRLFLLDTDLPENSDHDRAIAHRLYGGDRSTRIEQEMVLGIAGARALAAMGIKPAVWHINEGHAAFLVLERMRALIKAGLDFETSLEAVAGNTVFTTHTPVPAGHDHFDLTMMAHYFTPYMAEMGVDMHRLVDLGATVGQHDFNMTALAVRGSRFQNGVSRIHGDVSAEILQQFWPEVPEKENPVSYVTNGVHVPTFLAPQWYEVFDRYLGFGWQQRIYDKDTWAKIDEIPDHFFWSIRQDLKVQLMHLVRHRVTAQCRRNQVSDSHIERMLRLADPTNPRALVIGFARRFATYKRGTLLFSDLKRLHELVSNPERPVLFIFSGKAHPADLPGQEFIREIYRISQLPEFLGHVLLVEGYDLRLARRLVSGSDVWLNNPIYPLEASGTSGMKAAMNGVLNLSVLDGWWGEGYEPGNGWAVVPSPESMDPDKRDREESETLYELIQDQVVPTFFRANSQGYSPDWVKMAKHSIRTLLPTYSSARMVDEYVSKFYLAGIKQGRKLGDDQFRGAKLLAGWKTKVRQAWGSVGLRLVSAPQRRIGFGDSVTVSIAAGLNGLQPEDVKVELILSRGLGETVGVSNPYVLSPKGTTEGGELIYELNLAPELCGKLEMRVRIYPHHELLSHPMETGLMKWL